MEDEMAGRATAGEGFCGGEFGIRIRFWVGVSVNRFGGFARGDVGFLRSALDTAEENGEEDYEDEEVEPCAERN